MWLIAAVLALACAAGAVAQSGVKVVAQISFTATGGTTGTQTKTMKLYKAGSARTVRGLAVSACALPPH
jgi:hypothetical protein